MLLAGSESMAVVLGGFERQVNDGLLWWLPGKGGGQRGWVGQDMTCIYGFRGPDAASLVFVVRQAQDAV